MTMILDGTITFSDATVQLSSANTVAMGVGQTWTNVTGSRAYGSTYTNNTGKPITVSTWGSTSSSGANLQATVGGVQVSHVQHESTASTMVNTNFIVPPGATYTVATNSVTLVTWVELR